MDLRRSVNTKIWADDWFETLKANDKLIWIYLLTNAQTNMLGIYELSLKRTSFETGLNKATIEKALKGFERVKKAFYWFGWIVLPNWMKNQSLNSNMLISAQRFYSTLPNDLIIKLTDNGMESFESLLKGCQSLPKIEKEKESEKESEKENSALTPEFILSWEKDKEAYDAILKFYPKMFRFKKPLSRVEHSTLCKKFNVNKVFDIYGQMENKPDLLKKYESGYLTANNWLKR